MFIELKSASRNGRPAYSVEPITTCDKIALHTFISSALAKRNARPFAVESGRMNIIGLPHDGASRFDACSNQVFHYFLLPIHRDTAPARKFVEIDAMPLTVEEQ